MSFNPYVPCNCVKEGKTNWPSYKEKLEIRNGLIDVKFEFIDIDNLVDKFDSHKLCDHNQIAIEFSMSQSIIGWREHVQIKYPNRFPNFIVFIPTANDSFNHDYDKLKTVEEIEILKTLEEEKYHERLDQFINLLVKAIELNQEIYW